MRLRLLIRGRVQGVGYRYFVRSMASERGLTGWVRNCPDGSVECEAQGNEAVLREFIADLRDGPALSRVDSISEESMSDRSTEKIFDITY